MCIFFNMYDILGEILYRTIKDAKWKGFEKNTEIMSNFEHAEMPNAKSDTFLLYSYYLLYNYLQSGGWSLGPPCYTVVDLRISCNNIIMLEINRISTICKYGIRLDIRTT